MSNNTVLSINQQIYDLEDGDPLFDIRISGKYHGTGIVTVTVKWLKNRSKYKAGYYTMRCVFHKCGFVKKAWLG